MWDQNLLRKDQKELQTVLNRRAWDKKQPKFEKKKDPAERN